MSETIDFVVRHGYAVLFVWVLAEQLGVPVPAVPILIAAGALAGDGKMSLAMALLLAVCAALASDLVWYQFGRQKGASVLSVLCRIALEPDSCVRRAEGLFERHGARSLLFAKFIPGLSTAAPPVAGMFGMSLRRFLQLDAAGSLLWAATFVGAGYIFSHQLEAIAAYATQFGTGMVVLVALALAAYVALKFRERRRFVRSLGADRITPQELLSKMDAHEELAIVDLRHPLDYLPDPRILPGAIRMTPEQLESRHNEIPRDRDIVLYCT
ncbi:MAG TPA: VTT domain-containing protein [Clostridia bacterium]|nr:VTT domain-containing protein [Clostridia bacterium]